MTGAETATASSVGHLLLLVFVQAVQDDIDGQGLVVMVVEGAVQVLHLVGVDSDDQFENRDSHRPDHPYI